jgi:hypothetical protein
MRQSVKNGKRCTACRFGLIVVLLMLAIHGTADASERDIRVSHEQIEALNYLLGFVGRHRADLREFQPEKIAAVLRFVDSPKNNGTLYHADGPDGTPSAYFETDIARSLDQIVRLTDNPDVPAVFTAPSTVRMARWESVDTRDRQLPKLWEHLPKLSSPVFFTGIEHLVNTPDQSTGAYYEYDLYRSVMLTKSNGRNLLISLSSQAGVSDVGKRGLIIGPDDHWNYLYTGQSGLNRRGLAWVDSYMYDSYSVAFYLENSSGTAVRFGMFKWLRAGWSNINFVRRAHIYTGVQRFADTLKRILETLRDADIRELTRSLLYLRRLPEDQLRPIVWAYLGALQNQAETRRLLSVKEVTVLFEEGGYLNTLGREEMQSIVVLEYLKDRLGKPHHANLKQLLPNLWD